MSKPNESDSKVEPLPALEEGRDYYLEQGLMVFTGAYLLKRGFCCESGCRHCPYSYVKDERDLEIKP
jgi:hypothetical protein